LTAYAGAGELKRWLRPADDKEEASDPALDRMRKGGLFVGFWLALYAAAVLWRMADASVPMPHELKGIVLRVVGVFFAAYGSRRAHRLKKAIAQEAGELEFDSRLEVKALLTRFPQGLTRREITTNLPLLSSRTLTRILSRLVSDNTLVREGHPKTPSCLYRLPVALAGPIPIERAGMA